MPAGFRRRLLGKTLINVFSVISLGWQASDHVDIFINQWIEFYLNNTVNPRQLTPQLVMLYPQNGDRIVAIDSVTISPYV